MIHDYSSLDFTGLSPDQISQLKKKHRQQARKASGHVPSPQGPESPRPRISSPSRKGKLRPPAQPVKDLIKMTKQPDGSYIVTMNRDLLATGLDHWGALVRVRELQLINTRTDDHEAMAESLRLLELARRMKETKGEIPEAAMKDLLA